MIKNLNKKLFFLVFLFTLSCVPSFAQAAVQYCLEYSMIDHYVLGSDETTQFRDCDSSKAACTQREIELEGASEGWQGGNKRSTEYNVYLPCRKIDQEPPFPFHQELNKRSMGAKSCTLNVSKFDLGQCIKVGTAYGVSFILQIMSWLLRLANLVFNLVIYVSIANFASYANMDAIKSIWSIGRDLANVLFIFILIYIAIATIIQKTTRDTKTLVVELIITALLINFSIIIPKAIIDVGNSLAIVFYQSMGPLDEKGMPNMALALTKGAGIEKFYGGGLGKSDSPSAEDIAKVDWNEIIVGGLGTAILMGFLIYVLLLVTWLFLVRTVTLLIIIATSSLVFFSRIVPPQLGLNQWDRWFNALIKETFFAPAFLFIFYMVLKLATSPLPSTIDPSNTAASLNMLAQAGSTPATAPTTWDMLIKFILLIGLSLGSVMVSRSMASESARLGSAIKKHVAEKGGGWAARNTLGRLSKAAADSKLMKNVASGKYRIPISDKFGLRSISRIANNTTGMIDGAAKYSRRGLTAVAGAKMGGTSFVEGQKQYTERAKADMEGMDKAQKASYLANINERWTGKGKNELEAERIKDLKSPKEQLDALNEIKDAKTRAKVLEKMGDGRLPELIRLAKQGGHYDDMDASGKPTHFLKTYLSEMSTEQQQKIEDAEEKVKKKEEANVLKAAAQVKITQFEADLNNPATSPAVLITQLKAMKKDGIANMSKDAVNKLAGNSDLLKELTTDKMVELFTHSELEDMDELKGKLEGLQTRHRISPSLTPAQEGMLKQFTDGDSLIKLILAKKAK